MQTLIDRLKLALNASKLGSQRQLALQAKLRPATITRWMQGETKTIRQTDLEAVARVLDVSPDWLRTGEGEMIPMEPSRVHVTEAQSFYTIETLSEGANVLVIGQALQAMLKALPPRGINLDDPRLAQVFQAVIRRSAKTKTPPDEKMVLDELIKPPTTESEK